MIAAIFCSLTACFFDAAAASHQRNSQAIHWFGTRHARLSWVAQSNYEVQDNEQQRLQQLNIFHITDSHVSISDDFPPGTTRMFNAFQVTTDKVTREDTTSSQEFVRLLELACAKRADLIVLGGDIINFPSSRAVKWVLEQLAGPGCGIPFIYTAGNHDWHVEGRRSDQSYDTSRESELASTLQPLFTASITGGDARLYGHVNVRGADILFFDNSNYQINEEQLEFAKSKLACQGSDSPAVILMHMPLALPGVDLPPEDMCGHPEWGSFTDGVWEIEARPRWPEEGNLPSTKAFIEFIRQQAAPSGSIAAILTGHVHRDFSNRLREDDHPAATNFTSLICDDRKSGCSMKSLVSVFEVGSAVGSLDQDLHEATGAVQYSSLDAAEGGFRLLTLSYYSS